MSRNLLMMATVVAMALVFAAPAFAEDVMEQQGDCTINWSKKFIQCKGQGSPNLKRSQNVSQARLLAEAAAKADAQRNIIGALKGVKVKANITVGQEMNDNHEVSTKIEGVVKNFQVVATRYYSDGGVEVDVKMALDGALTKVVLQKDLKVAKSDQTTGVIVVAKGKSLVPVLAPRILDAQGNVIYGAAMVSEAGAKNGIVAYHGSVNEAKDDTRVSDNPLVIDATDVKDAVDVVISVEDAKKLKELDSKTGLFSNGRVVFVK